MKNKLYFVSEDHKNNYEKMVAKFPSALCDTEYQVACYVSAAPFLFYKFADKLYEFDTPLDWILNWQMKYEPQMEDESDEDYKNRKQEGEAFVNYDLTPSMQQMGEFALNLFNGYKYFNLMNCIGSLDEINYRMFKCALDVRLGYYRGQ